MCLFSPPDYNLLIPQIDFDGSGIDLWFRRSVLDFALQFPSHVTWTMCVMSFRGFFFICKKR